MHNDDFRILSIFYNRLKSVIDIADRKTPNGSVLLPFFEMKKNARYRLLCSVSLPVNSVSDTIIKSLMENELISPGEEFDHYRITPKGIWVVEQKKGVLDTDILMRYLNEKFFTFGKRSDNLSDREKVIVLLFLSLRAFSKEACIDLKQGDSVLEPIQEAAVKCVRFLTDLGEIKSVNEKVILNQKGNEHPISNLIRHTDALPRKTKGMYTSLGSQRYYLDVSVNRELNSHKLAFLISALLDNKHLADGNDQLAEFMESVSLQYSIFVYSSEVASFSSPTYDSSIREALSEAATR